MKLMHIRADVRVPAPKPLRFNTVTVGWLPADGWFCTCGEARRCEHRDLVVKALSKSSEALREDDK